MRAVQYQCVFFLFLENAKSQNMSAQIGRADTMDLCLLAASFDLIVITLRFTAYTNILRFKGEQKRGTGYQKGTI